MTRRVRAILVASVVALALAGCSTVDPLRPPTSGSDGSGGASTADDPVRAAADTLRVRYELVRDGDYAAACELYSPGYLAQLAELAEADAGDCVAVHEAGAANAAEYLETAEAQGRAGLTPFFYVPSGIEIDESRITSDDPRVAIASAGAVVSTDPREFEDGTGETPGWLSGVTYLVRGDDGVWRFATAGEA